MLDAPAVCELHPCQHFLAASPIPVGIPNASAAPPPQLPCSSAWLVSGDRCARGRRFFCPVDSRGVSPANGAACEALYASVRATVQGGMVSLQQERARDPGRCGRHLSSL